MVRNLWDQFVVWLGLMTAIAVGVFIAQVAGYYASIYVFIHSFD